MQTIILFLGFILIGSFVISLLKTISNKHNLEERLTEELKGLTTQKHELEKEIARKNSLVIGANKRNADLEIENSELSIANENLVSENHEKTNSIARLKKDVETLTNEVAVKQNTINELSENNISLIEERDELKRKLARPKGKKVVDEKIEEEQPQQSDEQPATTEKTQQYYIDEFYKFLKKKNKKLPARFDKLYDKEEYPTVEEFLKYAPKEYFINTAFAWNTDDMMFWGQLDDEWCEHLKTL